MIPQVGKSREMYKHEVQAVIILSAELSMVLQEKKYSINSHLIPYSGLMELLNCLRWLRISFRKNCQYLEKTSYFTTMILLRSGLKNLIGRIFHAV